MKTIIKIFVIIILMTFTIYLSTTKAQADTPIVIHFFYQEACPRCHEENNYLIGLESENSGVTIIRYEISDALSMALFDETYNAFNNSSIEYNLQHGAPFTVIGGYAFSGFNDQSANDIEKLILRYSNRQYVDIVQKIINDEVIETDDFDTLELEAVDIVTLPILGDLSVENLSLGLTAILLGFVDGFNPCAMWILVFLIALLANQKNRKRMWILGSTFLFTSALVYFLVMMAWIQLASSFTQVVWIRIIIGIIALLLGALNIVKFIKTTKTSEVGCDSTSVKQRGKIVAKIKNIVSEQNLLLALIGIIILAVSVNVIEFACSAGFPLLFSQILAFNQVTFGTSVMYTILYVIFFMLDDLIVFSLAMITLRVSGITNKYSKFSHLIGGIIMILIGFLLIFFPSIIMLNF